MIARRESEGSWLLLAAQVLIVLAAAVLVSVNRKLQCMKEAA